MRFIKSTNEDSNQYFYIVLLQLIFFGMTGMIYKSRMQREALCGDPEDLKGTYVKWNGSAKPIVYCHSNGTCTYSTHKTPSDSTDDAVSTAASFYWKIFYFWIGLVLSIPFLLVVTQLQRIKIKILSRFLEFAIRAVYFCLQIVVKVVVCFFLLLALACAYFTLLFTIHYLINGTLGEPLVQLHNFIKVAFIESEFPHDEIDCSKTTTHNQWSPSATIYSSIDFFINWIPVLSFGAWKFSWILSAETIHEKMGVLLYCALRPAALTIGTWCATYFGSTVPVSGIRVSYDLGFFMGWIYVKKVLNEKYPKLKKTA